MKGVSVYRAVGWLSGRWFGLGICPSLGVLYGQNRRYLLAHSWIANLIRMGYRVHVIGVRFGFNVSHDGGSEFTWWEMYRLFGWPELSASVYALPDTWCLPRNIESEIGLIFILSLASSKQIFDGDVQDAGGIFLLEIDGIRAMQEGGIPDSSRWI